MQFPELHLQSEDMSFSGYCDGYCGYCEDYDCPDREEPKDVQFTGWDKIKSQ